MIHLLICRIPCKAGVLFARKIGLEYVPNVDCVYAVCGHYHYLFTDRGEKVGSEGISSRRVAGNDV